MHGQPWYPPPPPPPKPPGLSPLAIVLIVIGGMVTLGGGACVIISALVIVGAHAELDNAADASPTTPTVAATTAPSGTSLGPMDDEPEPPPANTQATAPKAAASSAAPKAGGSWWCTASASVRVCGFAGACNYQMVFGNGGGTDRFIASQQAKMACEASARAKGASAVCIVQCSAR